MTSSPRAGGGSVAERPQLNSYGHRSTTRSSGLIDGHVAACLGFLTEKTLVSRRGDPGRPSTARASRLQCGLTCWNLLLGLAVPPAGHANDFASDLPIDRRAQEQDHRRNVLRGRQAARRQHAPDLLLILIGDALLIVVGQDEA